MGTQKQRFTVDGEGGTIVRVHWSPSIILADSDGRSLTSALNRELPGQRAHLLMFLNGMTSLSQEALSYMAKRAQLSAIALVGPSVLDEKLVDLYLELYAPPFTLSYFELESEARAWLARQPSLGPPTARR